MKIEYQKVPSASRYYTAWLTFDNGSAFLIGTVYRTGQRNWVAKFDDGRGPNPSNGITERFQYRGDAAEWLKEVSGN